MKVPRDHECDLVIKPIGQLLTPLNQVDFIMENMIELKIVHQFYIKTSVKVLVNGCCGAFKVN